MCSETGHQSNECNCPSHEPDCGNSSFEPLRLASLEVVYFAKERQPGGRLCGFIVFLVLREGGHCRVVYGTMMVRLWFRN
jgi:hypothetical protein